MKRLIIYSTEDGSQEGVYFTEDFEIDADDICPPNCSVDFDGKVDCSLPNGFPLDYHLERN